MGTGYFAVPDEVAVRTDITASAKLVYGQILRRIGKSTHAWPSAGSLARDTGMGLNSAQRAIEELVGKGLLMRESRGRGRSNAYWPAKQPQNGAGSQAKQPQNGVRTCPKMGHDLPQNGARSSPKMGYIRNTGKISKEEHTPPTPPEGGRQRAKEKPDPWEQAVQAMTGPELQTERFKAAWLEWVEYKRQASKKLTAVTIKRQIHKAEKLGHDDAIASIGQSIEHGWIGLFEPTGKGGQRQSTVDRGEYPGDPGEAARL